MKYKYRIIENANHKYSVQKKKKGFFKEWWNVSGWSEDNPTRYQPNQFDSLTEATKYMNIEIDDEERDYAHNQYISNQFKVIKVIKVIKEH